MTKGIFYLLVAGVIFSGFSSASQASQASERGFVAKVVRIVDGDTLDVLRQVGEGYEAERIRLAAIDAPESSQDFGNVSRQALAGLCFGRMAQVKPIKRERHQRLLATIECDGLDAGAVMVSAGMAWVYTRYSSDHHLIALQNRARADRLGLWSMPSPMPPWEYRRNR